MIENRPTNRLGYPRSLRLLRVIALAACSMAFAAPLANASPPGNAPHLAAELNGLHLIDYFPSEDGWGSMWWHWEPGRLSSDFARISALNGNAVRIIISAPAFGFPGAPSPVMESRLEQTIEIAASHGLRVELTLFNEWEEYREIAASESWASQVLAPLAGSHEIAYIDLRNELPVATSHPAALWAQALVPYVKSISGGIPVTISASISSGVDTLQALAATLSATPPDLYDVHYYGGAADAYAVLVEAKAIAGATPLIVGETGFATSPAYGWAQGLAAGAASLESYQGYYYRLVESATAALRLPMAAPWILYDMPGQGGTSWGEHMGILRSNGSEKPSAEALARIFDGSAPGASFNNGFEEGVGVPYIWRRWMPTAATFATDRTVFHTGSASARMQDSGGNHLVGCPAFYAAPIAAVTPGVKYSASVWSKGTAARGSSRIVLVWSTAFGKFISSNPSPSLPQGNSTWTNLIASATPPAGAQAVEIDLQVCENPGTTWFDDVSFSPTAETSSRRLKRR